MKLLVLTVPGLLFPFLAECLRAETETPLPLVRLDPSIEYRIGADSSFDREKFMTLHSAHTEPDWDGESDKLDYLLNELDTFFGRDSGTISWELSQVRENPNQPGFADFEDMQRRAKEHRELYASKKALHAYEKRSDPVVAAQVIPFWPESGRIKPADGSAPWSLASPEATAQYMVYWLNMYTGGNGPPRPRFLELMNEPLFELSKTHPEVTPTEVFEYHRKVARGIRALNPDILLGGYTAAFPDFEKDDFQRWHRRWKTFIDLTGDEIDFYSFHLYDFPGIHHGKQQYRKGANLEATFDLLEHYSMLKFGRVKPFLISEYGSQLHDWFNQPWSPWRDWLCLKAMNSMLMQMAEKPDRILKAIPFTTAKAEWGFNYGNNNQPYYWRLLRRENEPESYTGDWVFTDQVKFYELWSGVRGTRCAIHSDDPNLLVAAYREGGHLSVIVNNLVSEPRRFQLDPDFSGSQSPSKLIVKHLYPFENQPRLDWVPTEPSKREFVVGSESTVILEFALSGEIDFTGALAEFKYYATTYLQPIEKEAPLTFQVNEVPIGDIESATLRLGLGRDHGQSLQPQIHFNGEPIDVPADYIGPDQNDKERFFGVLEIPVPARLIQAENAIEVTLPDPGGHISSVALEVVKREN